MIDDDSLTALLDRAAAAPGALDRDEMAFLLGLEAEADVARLHQAAYAVKLRLIGPVVSLRGLIEMGNHCGKNCYYCGIRRDNRDLVRYTLDEDAVVALAEWAYREQYGSVVIQSGEIATAAHTESIARILRRITDASGGQLGITLSLGEQDRDTYARWREAGAHRYLLRLETSSRSLYRALHPPDHSFDRRLACLRDLRACGYQVGSGVMCGLPGQTLTDCADDIRLFRELDLDMIGMGPYIHHPDTPVGHGQTVTPEFAARQLRLGLNMIAVTRLHLHDVNIAAATALQALADDGRERGLLAGANVIMPNVTDTEHRKHYQLYAGKPCLEENATQCRACLTLRIASVKERILWGERGDSPHFHHRRPDAAPAPATATTEGDSNA
ncbi:MAG: [FeFe] hydrogenase H-cluster radical SAM maturase HydE [Planctomycetes bacterium]|nr:[FeFe] hydrogenase H-cluster radical SAM maturase HydE [Planctomycetota bacterium]